MPITQFFTFAVTFILNKQLISLFSKETKYEVA